MNKKRFLFVIVLLIFILFFSLVTASVFDWPMFHNNINRTGYQNETVNMTNFGLISTYYTIAVPDSPRVSNGTVYIGTSNYIFALNATKNSGENQIWNYTLGGGSSCSSPEIYKGIAYSGCSDNNIYAFNATNGSLIWNYSTGEPLYSPSSPAVSNGVVWILNYFGNIYALNATNGSLILNYSTGEIDQSSSPAIANGIAYISVASKGVYAFNATNGSLIWNTIGNGGGFSTPAVANGIVYSAYGPLYALNATNGSLIWSYFIEGASYSSPAVYNGTVYIGSSDKNVYAINATNGSLIWNYTTGGTISSSPAVSNGVVWIGSYDKNVYALNSTNGNLIWNYTTGGSIESTSSPAVSHGIVYIGSDDGNVYEFSNQTSPYYCDSCMSCNYEIQEANPGETVRLTASISNNAPTNYCIDFAGRDNVNFDCQGYSITSSNPNFNQDGIYLNSSNGGSNNDTISNCNIVNFGNGIVLNSSSNNTLSNINETSQLEGFGIFLDSNSSNNTLSNINTSFNAHGIFLNSNSNNNSLSNINSDSNDGYGIYLSEVSNNILSNINTTANLAGGFYISSSNNSILSNLDSNLDASVGVAVYSCVNNTVENSIFSNESASGGQGISVSGGGLPYPQNNTFTNIISINNSYGAYIASGWNNTFSNITLNLNSNTGADIEFSNDTFTNVTSENSNGIGFFLDLDPGNSIIRNSNMSNNSMNLFFGKLSEFSPSEFNQVIDYSNIFDYSYRLYYNSSVSNYVFSSANAPNAAMMICENCSNVTYKNLDLSHETNFGLYFYNTSNSLVQNINSSFNGDGIDLSSSSNNTLLNVTILLNSGEDPYYTFFANNSVYLLSSSNNTLNDITAFNNSQAVGIRIGLNSNNNYISNINAGSDSYGIYLSASNNILSNIDASLSSQEGIFLDLNSNNNTLLNVNADNSTNGGIQLDGSNNTLINITADYPGGIGILLDSSLGSNLLYNVSANYVIGEGGPKSFNSQDYGDYAMGPLPNTRSFGSYKFSPLTGEGPNGGISLQYTPNNVLNNISAIGDGSAFIGDILLSSSSNNTLSNINSGDSSGSPCGINLDYLSSNNNLTNVTVNNCYNTNGIILSGSDNILTNITADSDGNNANLNALYVTGSTNNLTNITATSNGLAGIYLSGDVGNILTNVNSSNNVYGILFSSSSYDTLSSSYITDNLYGLEDDFVPNNNMIYNNLFNNTIYNDNLNYYEPGISNFNTTLTSGTNILGGSFIGGNYWGSWSAPGTGFSDTCVDANSDGICDSPYPLQDALNYDYLPLSLVQPGKSGVPTITLNTPTDGYTSSVSGVTFNATLTSIVQIANVSLILNGVLSQTNSSEIDNGDYLFTSNLADGSYLWAYLACDTSDSCVTSQMQSLTVSTSGGFSGSGGSGGSGGGGSGSFSGGSAGSGSSGASTIFSGTGYNFYPNVPVTILVNVTNVDLTKLVIVSSKVVQDASITILPASKASKSDLNVSSSPGQVYQSFQINTKNIDDSEIANVSFYFRMNMSWMNSNNLNSRNVLLFRNTGTTLIPLNSTFLSNDMKYNYYSALSPGLSKYSIFASNSECNLGDLRCFGNDFQFCGLTGSWIVVQTCQYGCKDFACVPNPKSTGFLNNIKSNAGEYLFYLVIFLILLGIVVFVYLLYRYISGKYREISRVSKYH
ncbi:MAG: PQQ-binding-like beta-propeller repeat protein [Candidatus Nanoarchaeia archaeon]